MGHYLIKQNRRNCLLYFSSDYITYPILSVSGGYVSHVKFFAFSVAASTAAIRPLALTVFWILMLSLDAYL